jgi:hypothetical protein
MYVTGDTIAVDTNVAFASVISIAAFLTTTYSIKGIKAGRKDRKSFIAIVVSTPRTIERVDNDTDNPGVGPY